jgi:hypothetical protein
MVAPTGSITENLLHRQFEVPGQLDREWERRGIALGLDRVDRLPGHVHRRRELGLGQASSGPQRGDPVPHFVSSMLDISGHVKSACHHGLTPMAADKRPICVLSSTETDFEGFEPTSCQHAACWACLVPLVGPESLHGLKGPDAAQAPRSVAAQSRKVKGLADLCSAPGGPTSRRSRSASTM